MKSGVYRTLVLTKRKPITPGHSRTPPWGILALCTVEYKTSMRRNTNGGHCVCLSEYYQDMARIHAACSFHTHPELLISIPAIHELPNHTLFGYLGHAPALCWLHYVYITMLYMNACMPRYAEYPCCIFLKHEHK
jgi:hypothetical protein